MKTRKHFMALAVLAGIGLALGACSSSNDDNTASVVPPTMTPMTPEPTPEPTSVAVDLPTLPTGDMYALSADTHEIAAGGTDMNGGVSFMCAAGGEACVVTVAADRTATSTGGTVTASRTDAAQMAYDNEKKPMMAEMEGRASGLFSALTDATGTRGVKIRANEKNSDFSISRDLSGAAMVSDGGKSGWSTRSAPNALTGWQGTVLDNGKMQTYTVYTDIVAAKRKAYDKAYFDDDGTH